MSLNILVTLERSDKIEKLIADAVVGTTVTWYDPTAREEDQSARLSKADVIFGAIDTRLLSAASSLKWHHITSAGVEQYSDRNLYATANVLQTNSSGIFGDTVAEYVIGMMIMLTRKLLHVVELQSQQAWDRSEFHRIGELRNSTLGIVGFGDIGVEVAKRAKSFKMRVIALKRRASDPPPYVDQVLYGDEGLEVLLRESDHVVACLPSTEQTRGLLSRKRLALMKRSAYLYNVGRSDVMDEDALIEVLSERRIAGAGLDVFADEPLAASSPLWRLPNVIVSPHVSGMMPHFRARVTDLFCQNLKRFVSGRPLLHVVDPETNY